LLEVSLVSEKWYVRQQKCIYIGYNYYITPLRGSPTAPHYNRGGISGNYERISTKFPVITLPTRRWALSKEMLKYVNPSWNNPIPLPLHSKVGDISSNYKQISTKFSVVNLQTRRWVLGKKFRPINMLPLFRQAHLPHSNRPTGNISGNYERIWVHPSKTSCHIGRGDAYYPGDKSKSDCPKWCFKERLEGVVYHLINNQSYTSPCMSLAG